MAVNKNPDEQIEELRTYIRQAFNYILQAMKYGYLYDVWGAAYHDLGQFHGRLDSILGKPLAESIDYMKRETEEYRELCRKYTAYMEKHPKQWPARVNGKTIRE